MAISTSLSHLFYERISRVSFFYYNIKKTMMKNFFDTNVYHQQRLCCITRFIKQYCKSSPSNRHCMVRKLRRLQGGLGTSNMLQFYIISNAELLLYLYEWIEKYDFELNRVFFKILSSQSFFKGKWLWVSKSNMADKTSYCLYFPALTARFVKKTVPIRMLLN